MPKIVPKPSQSPGSGPKRPVPMPAEKTGHDLLFAALFDGANANVAGNDIVVGPAAFSGSFVTHLQNQGDDNTQPQEDLLAMIAALQAPGTFSHKKTDKQNQETDKEVTSDQASSLMDEENPDGLANMVVAMPSSPEGFTEMEKVDTHSGEKASLMPAKMAFEDRKSSGLLGTKGFASEAGQTTTEKMRSISERSFAHDSSNSASANTKLEGAPAVSNERVLNSITKPPMVKSINTKPIVNKANMAVVEPITEEESNTKNVVKAFDDSREQMIGKKDKNLTTVASLKRAMLSESNMAAGDKVPPRAASGQNVHEMGQPMKAVLAMLDNASGPGSQAQTGGQSGGNSGGQTGSMTGGGLLNNLNMLQTLDMAKSNWSEMLLQRVQRALAGAKEHLDFQLSPRNLGKMRVSIAIQNDRTNIQIQTETSAAASMLSDAEGRLAQMLEASGLRLGSLSSGQSQSFGGNTSGGQADQEGQAKLASKARPDKTEKDGLSDTEITSELSENLINIQA
jgi:flagellar hook-length control protein FliK